MVSLETRRAHSLADDLQSCQGRLKIAHRAMETDKKMFKKCVEIGNLEC